MTVPEIISASKDICLAIAAAVTGVVALLGLQGWQRQLKGTAEFESARRLARSMYNLRDQIRDFRSPLISANEFPPGYSPSANPSVTAEAFSHVYRNRWEHIAKALGEFDTSTLEAEALWGSEIRLKTDALRECLNSLNSAVSAIIDNEASGGADFKTNRAFGVEMRSIAHASRYDDKNPLSVQIGSAIKFIEEKIRPHLKRR